MRGHRSQAHADPTESASRQHNPELSPNIRIPLDLRARVDVISLQPNKPWVTCRRALAEYKTSSKGGNRRDPQATCGLFGDWPGDQSRSR